MTERTLHPAEEESATEETAVETTDETEVETQADGKEDSSTDDGLESLFGSDALSERQKKELKTLTEKAKNFDGLARRKEREARRETPVRPVSVDEEKIRQVLYKENERKVLKAIVDENDPLYIAELVPDKNFQEVLGFLPRALDRSSTDSIHKGLRIAVRLWKEFKGIKETEKRKDPSADLTDSRGASASASKTETKKPKGERTFIKKQPGISDWYANNE